MGTSLINTKPQDTYTGLLKTGDNTAVSGTLKTLSDGAGNDLPMQASTSAVNFTSKVSANRLVEGFTSVAASGTQIVLTVSSTPSYVVTGSGGQTIKLPDATTLDNGITFYFNNNQSSGAITVNNNSNTLVASIPSGGDTVITLLSNSIAAGTWERHELAPSNVSWSTNTFDYPGSITGATWNGVAIADAKIASAATWNAKQDALGYTPENAANKSTSVDTDQASNTKYPSVKAVYDWAVGLFATISNLALKTDKKVTRNRQTASYTLVVGDKDKLVEMNVASANNLTVPASIFADGDQILLAQYGAGQTTVVAGSGMTIRSNGGKLKLNVQYSGASLVFVSATEAYLFGDITT